MIITLAVLFAAGTVVFGVARKFNPAALCLAGLCFAWATQVFLSIPS